MASQPTMKAIQKPDSAIVMALLFWGCGLVLVMADLADGSRFYTDYDDRMRALQIGELLAHGNWFDRSIHAIAMPETYLSPWSRLVDAPYVVITWLATPWLGQARGLELASLVWPPLLLAAFAWPAVVIMRAIAGQPVGALNLAVTAMVMALSIWDFTPGRIDHHNMQLVLMTALLCGLVAGGPAIAAVSGIAAVLSVAVGLECVPFIAVAFAGLGFYAVAGHEDSQRRMQIAGLAMAVATPIAGLLLNGAEAMARVECDAYSAPYIVALQACGAAMALVPLAWRSPATDWRRHALARLLSLALPLAAIAGLLAYFYPQCLNGPYAMIDPVSRAFWLERVPQEGSVLTFVANRRYDIVIALTIHGFILVASLQCALDAWRKRQAGIVIVYAIAVAAFIFTLLQIRFVRFPPAFVPLFLPWLIQRGLFLATPARKRALAGAAGLPVMLGLAAFMLVPRIERQPGAIDLMDADECKGADFSVLERAPKGRILAPTGVAFAIAEKISGHQVAMLPYHRASPGIARVANAMTSRDKQKRREALAPFDYVAVCVRQTTIDLGSAPLYGALAQAQGWPGLVPVEPETVSAFRLYKVDAATLQ